MAKRLTPRIVPPSPITVAVERKGGPLVAYGLIADISGNGACVWTDAHLDVGATLRFRISFAQPAEIHELVGSVVWDRQALPERGRKNNARCGVMWLGVTRACRSRLRELAQRAVPAVQVERRRFEKPWRVANS
ncbi:MAG: PilZ domain-containing protein [Acidobacteria bacterium]|jgi:hypothetical protein|nr:PilZ domain-containing protein [Acidobacteriota bacterium]